METTLTIAPKGFSAKYPELFHYTNLSGLTGIYRSNTLWSTNYKCLNDSTEVTLLKSIAIRELSNRFVPRLKQRQRNSLHFRQAMQKSGGIMQVSNTQAERLVDSFYEVFFEGKHTTKFGEPFITSFCSHTAEVPYERENGLLSQWRGYSEGGGYCVVFDTEAIITLLGEEFGTHYWLHLQIDKARYATADFSVSEFIASSIDQFDSFFARMLDAAATGTSDNLPIPEEAVAAFITGATLLKHEGFREENEVRIVSIPGTQVTSDLVRNEHKDFNPPPLPEILNRKNILGDCEYLSLFKDFTKKLPIKRIIVGPSIHQEKNYIAAKELTSNKIPIQKSKTPFIG